MNTTQWYKSWTLWFNVVTILLGTLEVINNVYPISPTILTLIMGIGNMILRVFATSKPVSFGRTTLNQK